MRSITVVSLLVVLLLPAVADAGQVYGTIVMGGQAVKDAGVEIKCGDAAAATGSTAADGAYRINVPQQGQCTLALPAYAGASIVVFSSPNPALYNLELVRLADGKHELRRR
jgi:hypothetical protein